MSLDGTLFDGQHTIYYQHPCIALYQDKSYWLKMNLDTLLKLTPSILGQTASNLAGTLVNYTDEQMCEIPVMI